MEERVECAECGERYDSNEFPFCPRCGGTRAGAPERRSAGPAGGLVPGRQRRRVQAGGLVLVILGAVAAFSFLFSLMMPAAQVEQNIGLLADQPGGELHLRVLDGGVPLANATVQVVSVGGDPVVNTTTGPSGWANVTLEEHAAVNVTVTHAGQQWSRRVLALDVQEVQIDVQSDPATVDRWLGIAPLLTATRILSGVLAAVALLVVAGGVAALRLRYRHFATAGSFLALVPAALVFIATLGVLPSAATLLLGAVVGLLAFATLSIVRGRDLFA